MYLINKDQEPNIPRLYLFVAIVFAILLGIMMLTGCNAQKRIDKICQQCPKKDSIVFKDKEIIKRYDSTIYVSTPPEILILENPCDSNKLKKFDIVKTKNGIKEEIKSDGKTIEFSCKDDSLLQVIYGLNIEKTLSKEAFYERLKTTNVCVETWLQKTYKYTTWLFYLSIAITILLFTIRTYLHR